MYKIDFIDLNYTMLRNTIGIIDKNGDFYPISHFVSEKDELDKRILSLQTQIFGWYRYGISKCCDIDAVKEFDIKFNEYNAGTNTEPLKEYITNKYGVILYNGPEYISYMPKNKLVSKNALITLYFLNLINQEEKINIEKQKQSLLLLMEKQ